jgi:hypothetical protein
MSALVMFQNSREMKVKAYEKSMQARRKVSGEVSSGAS